MRNKKYCRYWSKTKKVYKDLDICGCIRLIGQVVKVAIQDAMSTPQDSTDLLDKQDAQRFLFGYKVMEKYFYKYHLEHDINCARIRQRAREVIAGRKELKDDIDLIETTEVADD
jgi:hypothetical protein